MPVWRLQTSWQLDSAFPRDRMVITPHFDDGGVGTDPDGLCEDLATALLAWNITAGELRVDAYDAQGTVPVLPQGSAIRNAGGVGITTVPRELAVCLSFFNERNAPRRRGRLYIPACFTGSTQITRDVENGMRLKVAALVPIFTDLGGPDVDWVIYSRADDQARPVTNWYVDNEWDVMRSRGLRGTTRQAGTTSEA